MVLDPVVDRMERRGFGRTLSAFIIFIGFFAVLAGVLYFAAPTVANQGQYISRKVAEYMPDRSERGIERFLNKNHVAYSIRPFVARAILGIDQAIASTAQWFNAHLMEFAGNLIWVVIIPIVAFYALKDFHLILAKILLLVPRQKRDFAQTMVSEVTAVFAKYMRGLLLISFLNGLATFFLLLALRVPGALTLGLIAGLIYGVPYMGAIITVILVCGVAFVSGGLNYMMLVLCLNILLHQIIFDQVVAPRMLGGHVGLHPIWAIVALLMGNALLGLVGMLLAVPIAACIQLAILHVVPKLGYEMDLSHPTGPADTAHAIAEESKNEHIAITASEELHAAVGEAVETIEANNEDKPA